MERNSSAPARAPQRRSPVAVIWLAAIVCAAAILLATPRHGIAATGTPTVVAQVQVPLPSFNFDPTKWVQDAFGALLQSFSDGIRAGVDALWAANFITQTPRSLTYANEDIRGLYAIMQRAANAALALIATMGALDALVRPHFGLRYHSLSEFVPRLLVGVEGVCLAVGAVEREHLLGA